MVRSDNQIHSQHEGFLSCRLLSPLGGPGNYVELIEHRNQESFMAMHDSADRNRAWAELKPLMNGAPVPRFYQEVDRS